MFGDGGLTFQEFMVREPLPLSTIHDAVLDFLRDREDAVLFGAQAVNAYVDEPRMTQDVDIQALRADEFAVELREYLNLKFSVAIRDRDAGRGLGIRLYQLQKPKNRHLVDIRRVDVLPPSERVQGVLVVSPPELIAGKVKAYMQRIGSAKSFTDRRDLVVLFTAFPELKTEDGEVRDRLVAQGADPKILAAWADLVATEIREEADDGY